MATRKIANKRLQSRQQPIMIFHALSGECIVPWTIWNGNRLNVCTLSELAGKDLRGYVVITDHAEPLELHNLHMKNIANNGMCKVLRQSCDYYLENMWSGRPSPGWRRWYKEFRGFAADVAMHPGESAWLHNTSNFCFGKAHIRSLVPIILQSKAWQLRGPSVYKSRRPWHGAKHAIALKSGVPTADVESWMRTWCLANPDILRAIFDAIIEDGHETYFA